ncbi:MAG: hypothetical protein M1825_004232 [Sarcosagium campestre]|nr:MAG: hypothetical protein M1825_004232 [Sarcosagium campestre]
MPKSIPTAQRLELHLRDAVKKVFASGRLDELTVKRIRIAVEAELSLPKDYFKDDPIWKEKSKEVILREADIQHAAKAAEETRPLRTSPASPAKSSAKSTTKTGPKPSSQPANGRQGRPSAKAAGSTRKRKAGSDSPKQSSSESISDLTVLSDDSFSEDDGSAMKRVKLNESDVPKSRRASKQVVESNVESSEESHRRDAKAKGLESDAQSVSPTVSDQAAKVDSESDMSVLMDDEPRPKKGKQRPLANGKSKKSRPKNHSTAKVTAAADADPQEAEIKRLQGWLLKCGIRRLWHKELAAYDTNKAKINHLKQLLRDVGMDGRYSVDKARQVKEERELKAEVEDVQSEAKRWGKDKGLSDEEAKGPKRRLARGLKDLDIFGIDDGEETD